jgi:hypothetical protein
VCDLKLMLRRSASGLALPDVPLKLDRGPAQYPRRFRVAGLGGEAAALFLYFGEGFWLKARTAGCSKLLARGCSAAIRLRLQ